MRIHGDDRSEWLFVGTVYHKGGAWQENVLPAIRVHWPVVYGCLSCPLLLLGYNARPNLNSYIHLNILTFWIRFCLELHHFNVTDIILLTKAFWLLSAVHIMYIFMSNATTYTLIQCTATSSDNCHKLYTHTTLVCIYPEFHLVYAFVCVWKLNYYYCCCCCCCCCYCYYYYYD